MRKNTPETIYQRLETDSNGCQIWTLAKNHNGYGLVRFEGKQWRVHRLIWTLRHGPIPPGLEVLHRCDVRLCGEIEHLFLGTQLDNMADMYAKGRAPRKGIYERTDEHRSQYRARNRARTDAKYGPAMVRAGDESPNPQRVPKSLPPGTPLLAKECAVCHETFYAPAALFDSYKTCSRRCSSILRGKNRRRSAPG